MASTKRSTKFKGESFTYPLNRSLGNEQNDYVKFTAHQYVINGTTATSSGGRENQGQNSPSIGPEILLYMPNTTPQITNSNNWKQESFPGAIGVNSKRILQQAGGAVDKAGGRTGEVGAGFDLGGTVQELALDKIAKELGSDATTALAMATGRSLNPNVELIYRAPNLRSFSFDFLFSAKSREEQEVIDKIILSFKLYSSPSIETQRFMEVPPIWQVTYMQAGGGQEMRMNKFKKAALTDVTIQDNPDQDQHMSFVEKYGPVTTALNLVFRENDIIVAQDHLDGGLRGY